MKILKPVCLFALLLFLMSGAPSASAQQQPQEGVQQFAGLGNFKLRFLGIAEGCGNNSARWQQKIASSRRRVSRHVRGSAEVRLRNRGLPDRLPVSNCGG